MIFVKNLTFLLLKKVILTEKVIECFEECYTKNQVKSVCKTKSSWHHIWFTAQTNSLTEMWCSVIFLIFLVPFCESGVFKCGLTADGTELLEFYCSNFNQTVPEDCLDSFSIENITDKTKVFELKVGGCEDDKVKQLTESFSNIRILDISHSGVRSLDKFDLKHDLLMIVNASHNQLSEVPLKFFFQIPEMSEIDLSYNKISKINEFPNKIARIDLSHNNLSSIHRDDFANLTELEEVNLSFNSITKLDLFYIFPTNIMLKTLRLEKNAIKEFDYRFTPLMQRGVSIHISWQNITKFMFWNYEAEKIRVVRNSRQEGVLMADNDKFELHCNETSFKNIIDFQIVSNQIKNPTDMIHCLSSSLKFLELLGNFDEKFDTNILERLTNLNKLSLSGTKLTKFDMNAVKNHKKLNFIKLPGNRLKKIDNITLLDSHEYPITFDISDNQLENVPELLKSLTSKVNDLNLSGNFVGKLNATTFERFPDMKRLYLKNTSLSLDDLKPFDSFQLLELDISHNNLENTNFTSKSMALKQLQKLNVGDCRIGNISGLVKSLGPSCWKLNAAGNNLKKLDTETFDSIKTGVKVLNISRTHLTDASIGSIKQLSKLENLDLSQNKLEILNITSILSHLNTLHLEGNNLREVVNFTKPHFPVLHFLDISMNQFKCDYLATFMSQLKKEWPHMMIFGDPWEQKHDEDCHPKDEDNVEY